MIGRIVSFIFKRTLLNNLSNDDEFNKSIKDADDYIYKTRKWIDKQEMGGKKVPQYLKDMVGKK